MIATPSEPAPSSTLTATPSLTIPQRLNYAGGESSTRRKSATVRQGSEETILTGSRRAQLLANSRDLDRNFELAGWAARRHLDYVCDFEFSARHKDKGFSRELERYVEHWSLEENFEESGRFSREQFSRMVESRALFDGDALVVRLASARVQAIEGDRVRNDGGADFVEDGSAMKIQGVKVSASGRPISYSVWRRTQSGQFEFEREVSADHARLYGYFPRFDCVRGVPPFAPSLTTMRDVYDNKDLALARSKLAQLFGIKYTRNADMAVAPTTETDSRGAYEVEYGKGPFQIDLNPGDDAAFLESKTPAVEFQAFMVQMIQLSLKALDIPFSFYNESFTNFFGSRAAWHHYERSCKPKRNRQKSLLHWLTLWRLGIAVEEGELSLPSGMELSELRSALVWVPAGMPWWKPSEEINGDLAAIAGGLTSHQRVTKQRGTGDPYDLIDERAELEAYARERGVSLSYAGFVPPLPDDQPPAPPAATEATSEE